MSVHPGPEKLECLKEELKLLAERRFHRAFEPLQGKPPPSLSILSEILDSLEPSLFKTNPTLATWRVFEYVIASLPNEVVAPYSRAPHVVTWLELGELLYDRSVDEAWTYDARYKELKRRLNIPLDRDDSTLRRRVDQLRGRLATSLLELASSVRTSAGEMARLEEASVQPPPESPADILSDRSIFHVVRTLETAKQNADKRSAARINRTLLAFGNWHRGGVVKPDNLLESLDVLAQLYVGESIRELVGRISLDAYGPEYPPHRRLPWCLYPGRNSLVLIPGGHDPFTGNVVKPFYISVFPVTAYEWREFLNRYRWAPSDGWERVLGAFQWDAGDELARVPAVCMTYYDCVAYCFWLWATTPYRFRLPTESEWNFAATGGKLMQYPWGDETRHNAGQFSTSDRPEGFVPVDLLPSSGQFGLVGMAGNVWEYASTLWRGEEPVAGSDVTFPDLAFALGYEGWWAHDSRTSFIDYWQEDVKFVMKGGSWGSGPEYATTSTRVYTSFYNYGAYGGFRLAVSAVPDGVTGELVPEWSPFVNSHRRQARFTFGEEASANAGLSSSRAAAIRALEDAMDMAVGYGCPVGQPRRAKNEGSAWDHVVRSRYR